MFLWRSLFEDARNLKKQIRVQVGNVLVEKFKLRLKGLSFDQNRTNTSTKFVCQGTLNEGFVEESNFNLLNSSSTSASYSSVG